MRRVAMGWRCPVCGEFDEDPKPRAENVTTGEHVPRVEHVDGFRLAWCAYDGQDWPCPWSEEVHDG